MLIDPKISVFYRSTFNVLTFNVQSDIEIATLFESYPSFLWTKGNINDSFALKPANNVGISILVEQRFIFEHYKNPDYIFNHTWEKEYFTLFFISLYFRMELFPIIQNFLWFDNFLFVVSKWSFVLAGLFLVTHILGKNK